MRRSVGIAVVLALVACVRLGAESQVARPDWGWRESGFFLGEMVGVTGVLVCTVYVAVPVLMDMFWYAPAPTTWDGFWQRFGTVVGSQPGESGAALVCDVVFLGLTVVCGIATGSHTHASAAAVSTAGATTISLMGTPIVAIQP